MIDYSATIARMFISPWLSFDRPTWPALTADATCDVAIVGGGISGVTTLYYLLTETTKKVILLEQSHIASGASGNNAGLACIHIEKPIQELVATYGAQKTRQTFHEIDASWDIMVTLLDTIQARDLLEPLDNISLAITSVQILLDQFTREKHNKEFGRGTSTCYVVNDPEILAQLPKDPGIPVHTLSRQEFIDKFQIVDKDYIAVCIPNARFARLNSAKVCYKILQYLSENFAGRFQVYENSPIETIQEQDDSILLNQKVTAKEVILCTNGYKNFKILNKEGQANTTLHDALTPREGYMAAYSNPKPEPFAQGFFDDRNHYKDCPYLYVTHTNHLTILGGPEFDEPEGKHTPEKINERSAQSKALYQDFLKKAYGIQDIAFSHFWLGIMGYTANDLRWVHADQSIPHLYYNLGCNGIGIMPSVSAAKRIVALITNQPQEPALF